MSGQGYGSSPSNRTKRRHRLNEVETLLKLIRNSQTENVSIENLQKFCDEPNRTGNNVIHSIQRRSNDEGCDRSNCVRVSVEPQKPPFKKAIQNWALKHNVTHAAINDYLQIMNDYFPESNLPKDARTLLQTPKTLDIHEVSGGRFASFSLRELILDRIKLGLDFKSHLPNCVIKTLQKNYDPKTVLTLSLGVDGVPICNSNRKQFWPILGILDQCVLDTPFLIGLFYGENKPSDTNFLQNFINEMKDLENNGLVVNSIQYTFRISKWLADSPARSFLKSIKNHNGYHACERCTQRGVYLGRMVYSESVETLRTDEDFKLQTDKCHHTGESILANLKVGMVSQFPLDYLHLVCLGVGRKVFRTWMKGKIPHKIKLSDVNRISSRLVNFKNFFPTEMQRKPRSFVEIDQFKGTEFRTLLLYTGFPAMFKILDE